MTIILLILIVVIALQIPGIQYVFSLTGGTAIVALCYLFPIMVFSQSAERLPFPMRAICSVSSATDNLGLRTSLLEAEAGVDGGRDHGADRGDAPHTSFTTLDATLVQAISLVAVPLGFAGSYYTIRDL